MVKSKPFKALLNLILSGEVRQASVKKVASEPGIVFLDAREKNEFDISHLKGAIFVGFKNFSFDKLNGMPFETSIIVYCSVGYRSEKIAAILQAAGYKNVGNLFGGIFEWVNQGFPVVDGEGVTTKVHAFNRLWGKWLRKGKKVYSV